MLVLTRHESEQIVFVDKRTGEVIGSVMPCLIANTKVRLGFVFDPRYTIIRRELAAEDGKPTGAVLKEVRPGYFEKGVETP